MLECGGSAGRGVGAPFALEDAEIQAEAAGRKWFYSQPCLSSGVLSFSSAIK